MIYVGGIVLTSGYFLVGYLLRKRRNPGGLDNAMRQADRVGDPIGLTGKGMLGLVVLLWPVALALRLTQGSK